MSLGRGAVSQVAAARPRARFYTLLEELTHEFERATAERKTARGRGLSDEHNEHLRASDGSRSPLSPKSPRLTASPKAAPGKGPPVEALELEHSEGPDRSEGSEVSEDFEAAFAASDIRWMNVVQRMLSVSPEDRLCVRDCWLRPSRGSHGQEIVARSSSMKLFGYSTKDELARRDYIREALVDAEVSGVRHFIGLGGSNRNISIRSLSADFDYRDQHPFWSWPRKRCKCFIHPDSSWRLLWALVGLIFIVLDVLLLSLRAFGVEPPFVFQILDVCYWSLDVIVNFRIGLHTHWGGVVMSGRAIARNYLRTWFAFDLLIVLLDWVTLSANVEGGVSVLRYVRFARYVRLLRLVKFNKSLRQIMMRAQSELTMLSVKLFGCLIGMGVWIHLSATAWFVIGSSVTNGWTTQQYGFDELPLSYLIAVHWAASQLGGGIDVFPTFNPVERTFAVAHLMLSLCVLAVVVSKVTNIMHSMQEHHLESTRHLRAAQNFVTTRGVSMELAVRVRRYLQRVQSFQDKFFQSAEEEQLMTRLPCHLRRALLEETRWPLLRQHLVFGAWCRCSPHFTHQLVCDIIRTTVRIPDEYVFTCGSVCSRVYMVVGGDAYYLQYPKVLRTNFMSRGKIGGGGFTDPTSTSDRVVSSMLRGQSHASDDLHAFHQRHRELQGFDIKVNSMLCEAVLWTPWVHRGDLEPKTEVTLMVIECALFFPLAAEFTELSEGMRVHAQRFVKVLRRADRTDLFNSGTVISELVTRSWVSEDSVTATMSSSSSGLHLSAADLAGEAAAPDEPVPEPQDLSSCASAVMTNKNKNCPPHHAVEEATETLGI